MKTLVIYDSQYGNTEQIAKAIGGGIGGEVKVVCAGDADPAELAGADLLIIGSPTQGGRATETVRNFLEKAPDASFKRPAAAFDTRVSTKFVGIFGYAAGRLGKFLQDRGANLLVPPEGFFVAATKGPLKEGEAERAAAWAKKIIEAGKFRPDF
jgi:flavodoxin I